MKAIEYFWATGNISNGCNSSFISLIPKNKDAPKLGEFIPISLIGSYYKIIAKILANRIKKVIDKVIGEAQNAFLSGRYILDGVLITNEAIEFIDKKNRKCMVFKVDFEKAYDCVNWEFLITTMQQMGFGDKRCKWIKACLYS